MKVIVFGATGMVGQGVLRASLADPDITEVLVIGRTGTGQQHGKLREIAHLDFTDFTGLEPDFAGADACFFCLGVSSTGMSEAEYRHITYDVTLAAAGSMVRVNPDMTFVYVSGAGTDTSETGRTMWARVKGKTENDLLATPLRAYMMRPGIIVPQDGARSKTRVYDVMYRFMAPLFPVLRRLPTLATTTRDVGRAMLVLAKRGAPARVLHNVDINRIARGA